MFISFHFPENSLQSRLLRSKQIDLSVGVGAFCKEGARGLGGAGGLPRTLALSRRLCVRHRASFLEGDALSAPKLQARSAVCALPVPSHDQRREEGLQIERCASGGKIRQGRLRRESGTTRRSSLHWVFDGRCRADCAIDVPPSLPPERRHPRRQVWRYPAAAGRPCAKIGSRRPLARSLRVGERTNPALRHERAASCEAGSEIYRRLGLVLMLRA